MDSEKKFCRKVGTDTVLALCRATFISHDVGIKVGDGCTLYCDTYRRANSIEPAAGILAWSPFGKKFNGISALKNLSWSLGIPNGVLSGLEKFEGPDPATFVPRGFAVNVNTF